ncbi:hypothetical protein N9Y92_04615 [Chlamydiales bacterium]|nr:hypothetical protein [Chlamydiales bacterium]
MFKKIKLTTIIYVFIFSSLSANHQEDFGFVAMGKYGEVFNPKKIDEDLGIEVIEKVESVQSNEYGIKLIKKKPKTEDKPDDDYGIELIKKNPNIKDKPDDDYGIELIKKKDSISKAREQGHITLEQKNHNAEQLNKLHHDTGELRKAIYWAYQGTHSGSVKCMKYLALRYFEGKGVVEDLEEYYQWLYLGSALGDEECYQAIFSDKIDAVGCKHMQEQMEGGRLKAKDWARCHDLLFISRY